MIGNQFSQKELVSGGWSVVIVENEVSLLEINGPVVINQQSEDFMGADKGFLASFTCFCCFSSF